MPGDDTSRAVTGPLGRLGRMSDQPRTEQAADQTVLRPPAYAEPAGQPATRRRRLWSDLNLNGTVPARVRPNIGEWGPVRLPSTKHKKRARWVVPVCFGLAIVVVVLTGWFFWLQFR